MDFYDVLDQVVDLLRRRSRVTYRALKLQFKLDDEALETLKDELLKAQRLAVDEAEAEAENPGSVADLAAGADRATACPLCRGRPALDRPLRSRIPPPVGGPGADRPALAPSALSARVSTAVGSAHTSDPHRTAAPAPTPGRGDDCASDRG